MRRFLMLMLVSMLTTISWGAGWKGKWIQSSDCKNEVNTWQVYRKVEKLNTVPASVKAKIAVDSKYWLWINGRQVVFEGGLKRGPSPAGSYYDVVEIAPYLKTGDNTIALLTQFFGKEGFSHKSSGVAALLFDAEGNGVEILSDETWEAKVYNAYKTSTTDVPNFRLPESAVRFYASEDLGAWYAEGYSGHFPKAKVFSNEPVNSTFGSLVERPIAQWKNSGLKNYVSTH